MTAKRVSQILLKRSASIYNGMKARAAKVYIKMPFTLAEFRDWLDRRFAGDGEAFCDYSGEMILVEDFSVDHGQPISRGGTFGLSNLVLCSARENLRKGNMTREEYAQFKQHVECYAPEVQAAIWKRLEIGDVQRFSHFRRQRKLAHQ
jgi:hypothetical protein